MATTIRLRRDLSYNWVRTDYILVEGEPGYAIDTHVLKIGDGVSRWTDLGDILPGSELYNEILAAIDPPIDLTILFENALA